MSFLRHLRSLFRRSKVEADMAVEMQAHIEEQTACNITAGMSPEDARAAARRQFGGVAQIQEQARDVRGWNWLQDFFRDLRLAARTLKMSPGFSVTAIATLALGIGACTAIFSIVDAVVLRPLAYPAAQSLVAARVVLPAYAKSYPTVPVNARFYEEWRNLPAFDDLALIDRGFNTLTGTGEPVRLTSARISASLFATLRVEPVLGRPFAPDEDEPGKPPVVILSNQCWRQRFSADPNVINRTVMLDQWPYTVIGVLRADFRLPEARTFLSGRILAQSEPEVYLPKIIGDEERNTLIGRFNYEVVGRLAADVNLEEAAAQMDVVAARLANLSSSGLEARGLLVPLREAMTGGVRHGLFALLGAIAAVLLIASLNLSMLALARAERRSHDLSLRSALGATRLRLVRGALVESLVLSFVGGVLGCLFAYWGLDIVLRLAPAELPRLAEIRLNPSVFLFALATTFATFVIAGLIPACRATRTDAARALRGSASRTTTGGVGARRIRHLLVAIEAGVGTALLSIAVLFASSFVRVIRTDAGFGAHNALTTELAIPSKYRSAAERNAFHERLLALVATTPGVTAAATSNALPLQGETWVDAVWTPGDTRPTSKRLQANFRVISADYFEALEMPFVAGQTFRDSERDRNVAIVSAQVADHLWPGQDPIGRKIATHDSDSIEVIGVAGNVRVKADQSVVPMVYRPFEFSSPSNFQLVVRTSVPPAAIAPLLREAIHRVDPDVAVNQFQTMNDILRSSVAQRRFQMRLIATFALSALTLVGLGLYGVVSHSVTQRTRELGIRLAFGARTTEIYRLVLHQGLTPIVWGLIGGIGVALVGGRVIASMLYETSSRNPAVLATVAFVLLVVAGLACWLPARRAAKVDPVVALRAE